MELAVLCGVCLLISGVAIRLSLALAGYLGVMDRPGGHKQHDTLTPFVGGFGVISVLVSIFLLVDLFFAGVTLFPLKGVLVGAVAIFLTGLADDIWHLNFKPRFVVQAVVALSMVVFGDIALRSLGELLPGVHVNLGWLAVPVTVFATIGLINAVNMIDGIDGLSGSVSLVSLALTALVAYHGDSSSYVVFIVALMGGVGGFLYYNLRYPGNGRARVFLGDNGSMLLGFVFSWLFIGLSQGAQAVMTPVTALWLFALPLMDTVGVMSRRIWLGKSPFRPDRYHLHHLFVRAGFRVCDIVAVAVLAQVGLGLIGVAGWWIGVPEFVMFWLFLGVFAMYLWLIMRPWRLVPRLRGISRVLSLPPVQAHGIFVGYLPREKSAEFVEMICAGLGPNYDYQLKLYEVDRPALGRRSVYCVVMVPTRGEDDLLARIQSDTNRIKRRLAKLNLEVRLFMNRSVENDRRSLYAFHTGSGLRQGDRRSTRSRLVYSLERREGRVTSKELALEVSVPPACR